jgi:hypothetical protein
MTCQFFFYLFPVLINEKKSSVKDSILDSDPDTVASDTNCHPAPKLTVNLDS